MVSRPGRLLAHSCAARRLTCVHEGPTCHGNGKGPGDGTVIGNYCTGGSGQRPGSFSRRTTHAGPHPGPPRHSGPHHDTLALLDQSNSQRDEKKPLLYLFLSSARKRPNARIAVVKRRYNSAGMRKFIANLWSSIPNLREGEATFFQA